MQILEAFFRSFFNQINGLGHTELFPDYHADIVLKPVLSLSLSLVRAPEIICLLYDNKIITRFFAI